MPRDTQAERVYAWEWACETYTPHTALSAASCAKVVRWACDLYGVPTPKVRVLKGPRWSGFFCHNPARIDIGAAHRTPFVCLHEAAHAIACHYYGQSVTAHGPEWLGIYCVLLKRLRMASEKNMEKSLRYMGLRRKTTARSSPTFLKRSIGKRKAARK